MEQITISPLKAEDIDRLIEVAHQAWHACYPGIITTEQINYMLEKGYTRSIILHETVLHGITWLTIMDKRDIIGFVSVGPYGSDTMKLHKLYLLPEYHGKGIGALALSMVEKFARFEKANRIIINVNKHNARAIRSYQRSGWHIKEDVINDIGNGFVMDDYLMEKQLVNEDIATQN